MLNLFGTKLILRDKAPEAGGGGGKANDPPTVPPESKPPPESDPKTPPQGDTELDEFGYQRPKKAGETTPPGTPPKEGAPDKKGAASESEKVENPATGYGDEPPKIDDPPPEKKDDPPKEPPTDLEKKLEGLHKVFADKAKAQITELGLEGEKLDKFIALKKQEQREAQEWAERNQRDEALAEQRRKAQWHKELKEDATFGGDKFLTNVTRSEKILDEYLPELKKELTEAKQTLRPSVMRGLARLADALMPDDKLVQGDPPGTGKEEKKDAPLDPLAFYNS